MQAGIAACWYPRPIATTITAASAVHILYFDSRLKLDRGSCGSLVCIAVVDATKRLRSIASHPFFGSLRLAKAHPFPSPVILDEINPSGFECSADSRLNGQGNRYLPVYNLGSSDGCHADF